jgi:hypothetical protein
MCHESGLAVTLRTSQCVMFTGSTEAGTQELHRVDPWGLGSARGFLMASSAASLCKTGHWSTEAAPRYGFIRVRPGPGCQGACSEAP